MSGAVGRGAGAALVDGNAAAECSHALDNRQAEGTALYREDPVSEEDVLRAVSPPRLRSKAARIFSHIAIVMREGTAYQVDRV